MEQLAEIPLDLFYILKYRKLAPDPRRLEKKRAELKRTLRFFEADLGWLVFDLGHGLRH